MQVRTLTAKFPLVLWAAQIACYRQFVARARLEPPEEGPILAEYFDVGGIPVSLGAPGVPYSVAWDVEPPRVFDPGTARRNGTPISETAFHDMVAAIDLKGLTRTVPLASRAFS